MIRRGAPLYSTDHPGLLTLTLEAAERVTTLQVVGLTVHALPGMGDLVGRDNMRSGYSRIARYFRLISVHNVQSWSGMPGMAIP